MDWGVPDWRDANAYPSPNGLNLYEWWWEFTRRRPDYRELWTSGKAGSCWDSRTKETQYYPADLHRLRLSFQLNVLLDPTISYPASKLSAHYFSLNGWAPPPTRTVSEALKDIRSLVEHLGPGEIDQQIAEEERKAAAAEEAGLMLYSFDISKPLGPQLDRAEAFLTFWQDRRFGKQNTRRAGRRYNWPRFLRALDAREEGATYSMMKVVFWPGQTKEDTAARDTYEDAVRLRDNFPI